MNDWTSEWPTEEGMYWAYGRIWSDKEPRLYHCEVHVNVSGHAMYVCKGNFLFKGEYHIEGAVQWQKIDPPKLPALCAANQSKE